MPLKRFDAPPTFFLALAVGVFPMALVACSDASPSQPAAESSVVPAEVSGLADPRGPSVYEFTPKTMPGTRCVYVQNGYASGLDCDFAPAASSPDPAR